MRKIQILGAFIAVLAFSAVAVASASAIEWLIGGKAVTVETSVKSQGTLTLKHTGGLTGEYEVECDGRFIGTVGPKAADLTTLVEGLNTGEVDKVICKFSKATKECGNAGEAVEVKPLHLPWKTELLESGGKKYDHFISTSGKEPGYEFKCPLDFNLSGSCSGLTLSTFTGNSGGNSLFTFEGKEAGTECTDGGEGHVSAGKGTTEGAEVS